MDLINSADNGGIDNYFFNSYLNKKRGEILESEIRESDL